MEFWKSATPIELWPHQQRAVEFAVNKQAVGLSMPMGTGKTLTTATLLALWKPMTVLIVATCKIAEDESIWPSHLREKIYGGFDTVVLTGKPAYARLEEYMQRRTDPTAFVINYESVWREPLSGFLLRNPPDVLVVDESHHAKSPSGKAARFLAKLGYQCERKVACTGTVLAHSPLDAWAQSRILDRSLFGDSYAKFRNRYATMGGYKGKEVLSGKNGVPWPNQDELA